MAAEIECPRPRKVKRVRIEFTDVSGDRTQITKFACDFPEDADSPMQQIARIFAKTAVDDESNLKCQKKEVPLRLQLLQTLLKKDVARMVEQETREAIQQFQRVRV
jgi:hypothetical protein